MHVTSAWAPVAFPLMHGRQVFKLSSPRIFTCQAASKSNIHQCQPKLSSSEKKALRTKSQRLNDSLVVVQCGAAGLSTPFLEGLYDALRRNQLVKVRMGCSRDEKKQKTAAIEENLDCVCVHSIGSVAIFYRQKGLPAPRSLTTKENIHEPDATVGKDSGKHGVEVIGDETRAPPAEFKVVG
jgi:RNA-binding protein YhbY